MSFHRRFFIALLTFALGVAAVWIARSAYGAIGTADLPYLFSDAILDVPPPRIPEPAAIRFKHRHDHHHCGLYREKQ